MRSARRRPNHNISLGPSKGASCTNSETMNPCACSAACKAASEADPAIRSKQPHGSRRSCLFQQRPSWRGHAVEARSPGVGR